MVVYKACPLLEAFGGTLNNGYSEIGLFREVIVNGSILNVQSTGDVFVAETIITPIKEKILCNIQNLFFCINFWVHPKFSFLKILIIFTYL